VCAALVAQVIGAARRAIDQVGGELLVVEDAQRVDFEAPA
jgi:hypothetical protein